MKRAPKILETRESGPWNNSRMCKRSVRENQPVRENQARKSTIFGKSVPWDIVAEE